MNLNDLMAMLPGLTEAHRPIRLRLSSDQGVLDDLLLVKHVSGSETLCGNLEYRLLCVATDAALPLKQFIALPVELQFVTDRGDLRSVCGIVAQASAGQSDGGLATYQLVIRDALALMAQRTNTRVFRNMNEVAITELILNEWRRTNPVLAQAFDFDLSHLTRTYPARELTRQHRESDAAFLQRLWKRRGIAWFIRPGKASQTGSDQTPAHALVLFDHAATLPQNIAGTVRYHRDEYLSLMEQCVDLFRSLGHYAADHQAMPLDDQPQVDLQSSIKQWENGSNTNPQGQQGGAPVIGITAPAGISFATPSSNVSYAGLNHDQVAQQHMQLTAGQRFNLNAGKGISLFSHHDGIKAIAHHGKFLMQSQHDDTEINAAKNIKFTATDGKIVGMAKEIMLVAEDGSFIKIGGGITLGTSGTIAHKGASFPFSGPATSSTELPTFGSGAPDQKFVLKYGAHSDSASLAPNRAFEITMNDGSIVKGISDAEGKTSLLQRDAMHIAAIRILEGQG